MDIALVFAIALVSAMLQATIGFGFSILAMIFLPRLLPYPAAVTLNISIALMNTSYLSIKHRKHIAWKTVMPLLIPTLICGVIFTLGSASVDSLYMDMILGAVLIILSLYFIAFADKIKINPSPLSGALMGSIAGIGNGFFGIGGPPAVLYLMPAVKDKKEYLATIQCYFALCNIANLLLRIAMGAYTLELVPLTISGWCGVLIGTLIGFQFFKKMDLSFLKRFVYFFVGINGMYLIATSLIK